MARVRRNLTRILADAGGLAAFSAKRILGRRITILCKANWKLGDEITLIPFYEGVKRTYADSGLIVWTNFPDLLQGNPFVDAINVPCRVPDRRYNLVQGPADAPRAVFLRKKFGVSTSDIRPKVYLGTEEHADVPPELKRATSRRKIAFSCEAGWSMKGWPREYFAELAENLKRERNAFIINLGLRQPAPWADLDLAGKTSIREAARALAACDAFVGNDSGLLHLALAVGVPATGIYGPTTPTFPIQYGAELQVVQTDKRCRGCYNSGRMTEKGACPIGAADCMERIPPDEVAAAVERLLSLHL